ncbi:MAG: GerW family sporulation protein [Clostridia bacterium]|nr:GerW family sporulation protein [Clostridia bacterium]
MEQKNQNGNLMNMLSFVANQTMAMSKENSVMGEPTVQDGVTIIPVSKLTVGFAGGGADIVDAGSKKRRHPAGGGAQVSMTPMSFIVINEGEVEVVNLSAPQGATKKDIIGMVIDAVKGFIDKKKEEKKEKDDKKEDKQA